MSKRKTLLDLVTFVSTALDEYAAMNHIDLSVDISTSKEELVTLHIEVSQQELDQ